eukprot:6625259-Prymnesium_polylepis.1
MAVRTAAGPVAGGRRPAGEHQFIMQNVADDLLDGGAEMHHVTGDAGDRAGYLDVDEQCAA